MLDNKHPCNIGPSYQLKDRNSEGEERRGKKGLKKRPQHSNIVYLGCG